MWIAPTCRLEHLPDTTGKAITMHTYFTPQQPDTSTCQQHERSGASQSLLTDAPPNSMKQVPANDLCFSDRSQELPAGEAAFDPLKVVNSAKRENSRLASLSHVSNLTATLKIYANITKSHVKSGSVVKRSPGRRGKIGRFTRSSRNNLLRRLAMLRDRTNGMFVTLTYGSQFAFTPEECKIHLSILRKALTRHFPEHGAFWRLEVKERLSGVNQGKPVPHYHLLVYGVPEAKIEELRESIHVIWTRAVYGQITPFRLLRTEVKEFKNQRHAMSYASKYAAKEEPHHVDPETGELIETSYQYGRRWGTSSRRRCT